jgi:SAM-dependent methyltransferase
MGLSAADARRVYDRIGRLQDTQAFYEDPAIARLLRHARFSTARSVVEIGSGTGRLARRLLAQQLPSGATYLGLDLSPRMVSIATARLAPWADRARVAAADGTERIPIEDGAADRVLATYVLDLLDEDAIDRVLGEAHRVLEPDGLLCCLCLTEGDRAPARWVSGAWLWAWRWRPTLVGGCRPISLVDRLSADRWTLRHREVVTAWAIASEVAIAAREPGAPRDPPPAQDLEMDQPSLRPGRGG